MKTKLFVGLILLSLSASSIAGYGRGSSSGGFRSSSYSARSYSAPRTYSAPTRTIYRTNTVHHTNTVHAPSSGSGLGIGGTIAASAAGSMIGNALTNHSNNNSAQPAAPQVVYVNGQPQQFQQPIAQQNQLTAQEMQASAPMALPQQNEEFAKKSESLLGKCLLVLFCLFGGSIVIYLIMNRK